MTDLILNHEGPFRLGVFVSVLLAMALWEAARPRRRRIYLRRARWGANLGIVVVDTAFMRVLLPLMAVDLASVASERGWGLFNLVDLGYIPAMILAILLLDLVVYWQHRIFHAIPWLWRLHRVHHTDRDFDTTTALRFHPVEIVLSMLLKMAVVLLLGVPVLAVILFEVILNGMALFNHANLRLPQRLDGALRSVLVTPDMHRIHHSVRREEYDRNFGFNLSVWDRLFSSYCEAPQDGQEEMVIGQSEYPGDETCNLAFMLALPFRKNGAET
jgi:sterol desaturase/sphingolipid hydroxylase (fatty acid hydroxylase superfamily)